MLYSHQNVKFFEKKLILILTVLATLPNGSQIKKLSIHFGENKTKSILFERENKYNLSLIVTRNENVIKQQS